MTKTLVSPQRHIMPARLIVGLDRHYVMGKQQGIPRQWEDYNATDPATGPAASDLVPQAWYGVCHSFDGEGGFRYLCGMEARTDRGFSARTAKVSLPAGPYAVFKSSGPITQMQAIWAEIFSHWQTQPAWKAGPGPSVEFYPPEFDGVTGLGGFEIWVPL